MTAATAASFASGKSHKDENFPVASVLVAPRHRPPILAFYRFVRAGDDVADHATLSSDEKVAWLDRMERSLRGQEPEPDPIAAPLAASLAETGVTVQHACDLLTAFRLDATKRRYRDWDDLIDYCRYSAMPVGRYVLDVHGESRETWQANDALCAALQVINHLQDCAADYRDLDRVYIPVDHLARHGLTVDVLAEPVAPPDLRRCLDGLLDLTDGLLKRSRPFAGMIRDTRLRMEVAVIQTVAERLVELLRRNDPLSQRVHLTKPGYLGAALTGVVRGLTGGRGLAGGGRGG